MQGKKSECESEEYNQELKDRLLGNKKINEKGCWIWQKCMNQKGYGVIRAKKKNYLAHRLSYELFTKNDPGKKEVCHMCDTPLCMNPDHLFIGSHSENMLDAKIKKRWPHGEKHYANKLSIKNILEIRNLLKMKIPQRKIALLYNVTQSCIRNISTKITWKHCVD